MHPAMSPPALPLKTSPMLSAIAWHCAEVVAEE
jgi:hypothetical protein